MIDFEILNKSFGIEGEVQFAKDENNFVYITLSNKYSDARIYLYGAQITSFKPKNSEEILWMSPKSEFEIGKPIRGGIPVCFPIVLLPQQLS